MRKNGFVFMETVVVVCVLSVTLLMLYGSYSHILRSARQKKLFDTTDSIYSTYYVKSLIDQHKGSLTYDNYFDTNCTNKGNNTYICDISNNNSNDFKQIKEVFDVDKIYYLNPNTVINNNTLLLDLDATTIDYIRSLGLVTNYNIIVVKYKHVFSDGTYEVIHSSIEVV